MDDLSKKFESIEKELEQARDLEINIEQKKSLGPSRENSKAPVKESLVWSVGKKEKDSRWVQSSLEKIFSSIFPNKRKKFYVKNISSKSCYGYIDHKDQYIELVNRVKKLIYIHQDQINIILDEYRYGIKLDFFFILDINDEKYFEYKNRIMTAAKFVAQNMLEQQERSFLLDSAIDFEGQQYQVFGLTSYQKHYGSKKSFDYKKHHTASLNL